MAKNTLLVGALDSLKILDPFVSKGPAYDGRVKPELVAYSTGGSSNAAALVSGVVGLLQQSYKEEQGELPPSALLKAVLVNSAEDVGPEGIDFYSGYGNVNAYRALMTIQEKRFVVGSLEHGQEQGFTLAVPPNARNLKISLVWNDPAAEPNAVKAIVNDLDLSLRHQASGNSWKPWLLNPYPHVDSLNLPALRGEDHLNNIEQISLQRPEEGNYLLEVRGYDVPQGPQSFFIAYQWEEADRFSWTFPTASDNMPYLGERSSIFQWESSYSTERGTLEYSLDKGKSWQLIAGELDLSKELYQWKAPYIYGTAIARMRIGEDVYSSQEFSVSRQLRPSVGFNCSDSVMLSWPAAEGVENYVVYSMGASYLEPVSFSRDTFFIFQKHDISGQIFSVAPMFSSQLEGLRSAAFDYDRQGVNCYLAFFNARRDEEGIELALKLGTTYQIEKLHFERKEGNGFVPIQSLGPLNSTFFQFMDKEVKQGVNQYRARLELANGQEILTETTAVYFLTTDRFLVFPNPVNRQENLRVFSRDFNQEKIHLKLFSQQGKAILEKELYSSREVFSIASLQPGLYHYTLSAGKARKSGKLIVY